MISQDKVLLTKEGTIKHLETIIGNLDKRITEEFSKGKSAGELINTRDLLSSAVYYIENNKDVGVINDLREISDGQLVEGLSLKEIEHAHKENNMAK